MKQQNKEIWHENKGQIHCGVMPFSLMERKSGGEIGEIYYKA